MVKAPRIGAVKTRLARGIGDLAAWRFYRNTTARVLRRLSQPGRSRWRIWLAVTPDEFAGPGMFWPADLDRLTQGRGDLGARMAKPMQELPPGPVVVIGSDIPDVTAPLIAKAFDALKTAGAVVGPADDGGYWLIGLRRRPIPVTRLRPGLFRDIRWSGPQALADTLAELDGRIKVVEIDTLSDIDTPEDYAKWKRAAA